MLSESPACLHCKFCALPGVFSCDLNPKYHHRYLELEAAEPATICES